MKHEPQKVTANLWNGYRRYLEHNVLACISLTVLFSIDTILILQCLLYIVTTSTNPVLTLIGGFLICAPLTLLGLYIYQKQSPESKRQKRKN